MEKKSSIKFAAIGECMIELRHISQQMLSMSFAGDTFNVALYLARYQKKLNLNVNYVTAIGEDPYSKDMLKNWQKEGIATRFVQKLPMQLPGLYLVRTDKHGERQFYYYRSQSAARQIFYGPSIKTISRQLLKFDYLYFSGITLAILNQYSRNQLLKLLKKARQAGAKICFDTNYRPVLWENKHTAQAVIKQALQLVDIAMVTFEDEKNLFGDKTPQQSLKRLHRWGCSEVVIKLGQKGCLVSSSHQQTMLATKKVSKVIDTTAAGDSFNAAYLGGRIKGLSQIEAAKRAQQLAATVIQYPGAIIPRKAMPSIFD